MNINLLIFFALPLATITISIALQKVLRCPPLVAGIIFSIFLIVTLVLNNLTYLIATIAYTIISFITAVLVCIVCRIIQTTNNNNDNNNTNNNTTTNNESGCTCRICRRR